MIGEVDVDAPDRADAAQDDSFESFFAAKYPSAVRGAYLLTNRRDAAEDIAQDVFADLLRRWTTIRHPDSYLWRAVTNGARRWGRKHRRRLPPEPATLGRLGVDGDVMAVRDALAELPRAQREVLVLRFYGGLLEREIAATTRRPVNTVKSQLRRGIAALRKELQ